MTLRRNFDWALLALILGGFVLVAAQRLGTVPVPDKGDEAFFLQAPYEILYRGKFTLPMYRFLGGNIENVWHSLRPVQFYLLSGFYKVFGLGLAQGRAFNLVTAALTLLAVYQIGRRLFGWRVGLIAVAMLVSDLLFFERSRMLRNDFPAAMFAVLAFYLFESAEKQQRWWRYFAAGLAAGAGLMCHTNVLYMLGAIVLLMLLRDGLRVFSTKKLYSFVAGAFLVMAHEIIYDIIDYKNVALQYRDDNAHFEIFTWPGLWRNLLDEPKRYAQWYSGGAMYGAVPRTLSHLFQYLTIAAVAYLIVRCAQYIRRGNAISEPRVRVFVVMILGAAFFAVFTRKTDYYMIHLACWYALCVGILLGDLLNLIGQLRHMPWPRARLTHAAAVACVTLAVVFYGYHLARQNRVYLREVRNPELASFEEFKLALRSVVPEGVCPVVVTAPVIAMVFPENDLCFATIEGRMKHAVDIDGKDYALLMRHKNEEHWANELSKRRYLLGELRDTPYGNFFVYYTGVDPRYLALQPRYYQFFGRWRGHVSSEQIASGREVWTASAADLKASAKLADPLVASEGLAISDRRGSSGESIFTELCSVELKPSTAYQLVLDLKSSDEWEAVVMEETTGVWIKQIEIGGGNQLARASELFRTLGAKRVRIAVRAVTQKSADSVNASLYVSRISIREIREL